MGFLGSIHLPAFWIRVAKWKPSKDEARFLHGLYIYIYILLLEEISRFERVHISKSILGQT
jgi:hypothetical protein